MILSAFIMNVSRKLRRSTHHRRRPLQFMPSHDATGLHFDRDTRIPQLAQLARLSHNIQFVPFGDVLLATQLG